MVASSWPSPGTLGNGGMSAVRQTKTQGAANNHLHHINTEFISHFGRNPVLYVETLTASLNLNDSCSVFVPTYCSLGKQF